MKKSSVPPRGEKDLSELGEFADRTGCPDAYLPDNPTAAEILTVLLEAERCAIRTWSEVCDLTLGKDP